MLYKVWESENDTYTPISGCRSLWFPELVAPPREYEDTLNFRYSTALYAIVTDRVPVVFGKSSV